MSDIVYENPWLKVLRDDNMHKIQTGDGYGAVIIPIVVDQENVAHICFFNQYRYALDEKTLELPRGGTVDLEAEEAARELAEETGIVDHELVKIGELYPDTGILTTRVGVWVALVCEGYLHNDHIEEETGGKTVWKTLAEVKKDVSNNLIKDSMSLASLQILQNDEKYKFLFIDNM